MCAARYKATKVAAVARNPVTLRGTWYYVPFVLEDLGRLGIHASTFLPGLDCSSRCTAAWSACSLHFVHALHVAVEHEIDYSVEIESSHATMMYPDQQIAGL